MSFTTVEFECNDKNASAYTDENIPVNSVYQNTRETFNSIFDAIYFNSRTNKWSWKYQPSEALA